MKRILLFFLLLFFIAPPLSFGSQPMETLKSAIDSVIVILKDTSDQSPSQKQDQQKKIWGIFEQIFDFKEMARRTLANNWKGLTPQQQEDFSDIFAKFMGKNYLGKIQEECSGETVDYLSHEMLTESKATVRTKILRQGVETPIDYSMLLKDNTWRIYDVKIEGVSLLKNYRAQFRSILMKNSPEYLIDMLKKKIEDQD
jgi:phospholipid transport system substrate-binding protein